MVESIKTFWKSNELAQNTHVITTNDGCIVIDAGCPPSEIEEKFNLPILAVFITHGHYDHIKHIEEYDKLNIPIYANENIVKLLNSPALNTSEIFASPKKYKVKNLKFVSDGDEVYVLGKVMKCLYTPGHTIDGMCYLYDDKYLFSGDTLFSVAVGRVDLPTANVDEMVDSLNKLNTLDYQKLFTGHGRVSSKEEQNTNIPYFVNILKTEIKRS